MDFAGITEDDEDISIHLCAQDEYEVYGRTIHVSKKSNRVKIGAVYAADYFPEYRYIKWSGLQDKQKTTKKEAPHGTS